MVKFVSPLTGRCFENLRQKLKKYYAMTINKIQRDLLNIRLRDIFTKCEYL